MTQMVTESPQLGLVISYFGNTVAVENEQGQVFQCHLRRNQALPVVGDKVQWQLGADNTGVILKIEPRHSILARGGFQGKIKPIAANVDVMVVVMAPPPIFAEHLVDRYLIAAELLGIQAILVINKVDLLTADTHEVAEKRLAPYQSIPYPVYFTSVLAEQGLTELSAALNQKTAVLVGPSGVGKSSIISTFTQQDIRVRDVSPKGIGKHTTTATRLYHLVGGGHLIDSPGLRDFRLWTESRQEIQKGFKEIQPYLSGCRFRDCQHIVEPGCQLLAAAHDGKISPSRFASYLELMKQS